MRFLYVERVDDRLPRVDVAVQRRVRIDVDTVRDRELTVEVPRGDTTSAEMISSSGSSRPRAASAMLS